MQRSDLEFTYPEELVALEPVRAFRALLCQNSKPFTELKTKADLFNLFLPGDLLLINSTQVVPRRVFTLTHEILFLEEKGPLLWEVLFQAKDLALGAQVDLPGGRRMILEKKGLPQLVRLTEPLADDYFFTFGQPALPPYIQRLRKERQARPEDHKWYQTEWAEKPGSVAAPTASLHFSAQDLELLAGRGVEVLPLTLHVGAGTFLPIKSEKLADHQMHAEWVHVPLTTAAALKRAQQNKSRTNRIWALGTTATRAAEAWASGALTENAHGDYQGHTNLFIQPGYEFQMVQGLLTNFHQPGSTLLALVAAFAGLKRVREAYEYAISQRFALFSYGDLSVWTKN